MNQYVLNIKVPCNSKNFVRRLKVFGQSKCTIVVYLISAKKILPDTFDELFFPTLSNISVIQLVVDFGHCTNLASFRKSLQGEHV